MESINKLVSASGWTYGGLDQCEMVYDYGLNVGGGYTDISDDFQGEFRPVIVFPAQINYNLTNCNYISNQLNNSNAHYFNYVSNGTSLVTSPTTNQLAFDKNNNQSTIFTFVLGKNCGEDNNLPSALNFSSFPVLFYQYNPLNTASTITEPNPVNNYNVTDNYNIGVTFSPSSKYIYFGTFNAIFQVNSDTTNIAASLDTIAINDNYCFPTQLSCTDFWLAYLAANGKIYITSGSGVIDLHYINEPDSEGLASDMHLHALRLPCYSGRGNVYHPNYYLGPVIGSACDTLAHVGLQQHLNEIQNFQLSSNPSIGNIKIMYLLPQNQSGVFYVYDLNGRIVFTQTLSPWSSLQYFNLSFLQNGLYQCVIKSGISTATQKLIILKQ